MMTTPPELIALLAELIACGVDVEVTTEGYLRFVGEVPGSMLADLVLNAQPLYAYLTEGNER